MKIVHGMLVPLNYELVHDFFYADCIVGKEEKFQHKWHRHNEAGIMRTF